MSQIPPFIIDISLHLSTRDAREVSDAYEMAQRLYKGKFHCCDEELIRHIEGVAQLLLPMHPNADILIAALLHHARDPKELKEVEQRFGKDIRSIIASLSILECGTSATKSSADLQRMILALSGDIRTLIICLHDRLKLIGNSHMTNKKLHTKIAREILDVFAPLCAKLGIYSIKYSLETNAFFVLYPQEAIEFEQTFDVIRRKHGDFLSTSHQSLKSLLKAEGIKCAITTRKKPPYSIFRKMHDRELTNIADLYDLFGMRVLVDNVEDCYRVLGILHRTYRPLLHRIKDYIGMPKPNGYSSLHTTLLGLSSSSPTMPIEIQIRTHEMNKEAEFGIAAHWDYKEHGSKKPLLSTAWEQRMKKIQDISSDEPSDEADEIHEEISDRIYVLTPKGDPIELRKGATPLDFAFRIHTDVGIRFRMAKVNDAIAPIDRVLENGDVVEIMTRKEPHPSEQWIQVCRTKEARAKIRTFFQSHPHSKAMAGR